MPLPTLRFSLKLLESRASPGQSDSGRVACDLTDASEISGIQWDNPMVRKLSLTGEQQVSIKCVVAPIFVAIQLAVANIVSHTSIRDRLR